MASRLHTGMFCQKCGKELPPDSDYCPSCGTKVGGYAPAEYRWERRRRERERWSRRGWDPMDPVWGAVRAMGFLVVIGLTISRYPDVFLLLFRYMESWGTYGYPVLPPYALGQAIIFLFTASGVWGLISAGLMLGLSSRLRRPMRDIVSALFSLYLAYAFTLFYAKTIVGVELVLAFFLGLAVMVIVNGLITFFVPRRNVQRTMPPS
jgi:hypothetical protein